MRPTSGPVNNVETISMPVVISEFLGVMCVGSNEPYDPASGGVSSLAEIP
jgi:hypothetical protein